MDQQQIDALAQELSGLIATFGGVMGQAGLAVPGQKVPVAADPRDVAEMGRMLADLQALSTLQPGQTLQAQSQVAREWLGHGHLGRRTF